MFSNWLFWKPRAPSPYKKFELIEIEEKTPISPGVKSHLTKLLVEARLDPSFLQAVAKRLGWTKVEKQLVSTSQPIIPTARRGFFGEVLTSGVLVEFFAYIIPVQKFQFAISANQSLPGTDVIAIKKKERSLSEVCFVESKLRTTTDSGAAIQGYEQLKKDYSEKIPQMIRFVLARLYERGDPLFDDFLNYLHDRRDMTNIERFRLGLTWEHGAWTETVLENLEEEVDEPGLPKLVVQRARIRKVASLVKELFQTIGIEEEPDDD